MLCFQLPVRDKKYLYYSTKQRRSKAKLQSWGVESMDIEEFNKLSIRGQIEEITRIENRLKAREKKIEELTKRLGI